VDGSQGVPYYLDLAVDTWLEIRGRHRREPASEDFARTPLEVFDRFLRHLTHPEVETLKVLSTPRFWDFDLFKSLVSEFQTGYPLTAFAELCRFSFIDEDPESGHWRMHLLMRQSLQEHQAPELKERVHRFLFDYYAGQLRDISRSRVTEAHISAYAEANYHGSQAAEPESFLEWCNQVLGCIYSVSQGQQLELSLARESYQILTARLGPDHPVVVRTLGYLGTCYFRLLDYRSAEPLMQEALARGEKVLGEDSLPFLRIVFGLAWMLKCQERLSEAEPLYERVLATLRRMPSPDRILLGQTLRNLAYFYQIRVRYSEADALYREAISALREVTAQDSASSLDAVKRSLSYVLYCYGGFFEDQGRFQEAENLFREALEIAERAQASELEMSSLLNALGYNLLQVGRSSEAEPFLQKALAIQERIWGPDAFWSELSLISVAELYRLQGRLAESEQMHQRALDNIEHPFGPEYPDLAQSLCGLAEVRLAQGKHDEAEALFKRALVIREKAYGPDHPYVAKVLVGMGQLYRKQGRYSESEPLFLRALEIRERVFGSAHPFVAEVLEEMASLYEQSGRAAEARALTDRAKAIREHDPQTLTPNP